MRRGAVVMCVMAAVCAVAGAQARRGDAGEVEGFDRARLEPLHKLLQGEVDRKQLAGAVTLLARHGKVVEERTYGVRDLASAAPMTTDTIVRAYSMSKPITGVAMMILYEQGKWLPGEPVAKYVPELAHLKVVAGFDAAGKPVLKEPGHQPTMAEVMSHTAGFSYGMNPDRDAVDAMYKERQVLAAPNLHEAMVRLGTLPLAYEPGKAWRYSVGMDIEGYIIEKLSGQTLPEFMREHIFTPLGMKDTDFYVPAEKRSRFATGYKAVGEALEPDLPPGAGPDYVSEPSTPSGGGGLVSTVGDYFRFAQMLANGGELDGVRVLAPATVKLMTTNKLAPGLLTGEWTLGLHAMRPGFGYGFNGAVAFDPAAAGLSAGAGTYFWDGAMGTWFWVDPANGVVFVGMIQRRGGSDNHPLEYKTQAVVYGALVRP